MSDLHKKLQPNAFSITTENFVEFEEKMSKVAQCIEPYKNLYISDSYQSLSSIFGRHIYQVKTVMVALPCIILKLHVSPLN